jgi:hypothetical protein
MIELNFEYRSTSDFLSIIPKDKKYFEITRIGNRGWTSYSTQEDIDYTQKCKEGIYADEFGDDTFYVGLENSTGIIMVTNADKAYLIDAFDDNKPTYLTLTFDELIEILTQMRDFLKSVGK